MHPYRCSPGVVISHKGWRAHTFQKDLKLIAIGSTQTPKSGVVEWVTTLIKGTIVLGVATRFIIIYRKIIQSLVLMYIYI